MITTEIQSSGQNSPEAAQQLGRAVAHVEQAALLDSGRIPSLDGLRAISIAMVVGAHAINVVVRPREGHDYQGPWRAIFNGGLGVEVFFTISGFLITLLLLRESTKTGRINLIDFYIRRAFRIWPAFYFYIASVVVLAKMGYLAIGHRDILAACFFVFNYVPHVGNWWVAHSWSLSVEEQFYFFWPALLVLLGRRRAAYAALALLVVVPVIRVTEILMLPPDSPLVINMWQMGHTRMDSLMFGCAIALAYGHPGFQRAVGTLFRLGIHWLALLYLLVLAPLSVNMGWELYQPAIGYSLECGSISLLILWTVQHAQSIPGRVLNSRLVVHLGLISYSLYLWQQMFLFFRNTTWTGKFPASVLCALAMAEFSFFAIERPFLRLRQRTSRRKMATV